MTTAAKPRILEKHIENAVTALLESDGWRAIKMELNWSERKRKSVGEAAMADHLYIRYQGFLHDGFNYDLFKQALPANLELKCLTQTLWIEFKKLKGGNGKRGIFTKAEKASIKQRAWIARERSRGALVLLVGEDCPATIEGVRAWYLASGLNRRIAA